MRAGRMQAHNPRRVTASGRDAGGNPNMPVPHDVDKLRGAENAILDQIASELRRDKPSYEGVRTLAVSFSILMSATK
jgi:hypothetical protein